MTKFKVGDLVKIKYDGVLALVCRVAYHNANDSWVYLLNQPVPFRPERLEMIK